MLWITAEEMYIYINNYYRIWYRYIKVPYDLEMEVTCHFGVSEISQGFTFGMSLKYKKCARER